MRDKIVRHRSPAVLLLVDVVNHFEFPDGEVILKNALQIAQRLARLKKRARDSNIPVVYVNDNFGQWRSDAGRLLAHCLRTDCAGKPFVEAIQPDEQDYCVLKPMHSAFFQTPLDLLLRHLGASSIILAGIATNSCILCTATRKCGSSTSRWFPTVAPRVPRESTTKRLIISGRWLRPSVVTLSSLRLTTYKGDHETAR